MVRAVEKFPVALAAACIGVGGLVYFGFRPPWAPLYRGAVHEAISAEPGAAALGEIEIGATENSSDRSLPSVRDHGPTVTAAESFLERPQALDSFYRALARRLRGEPVKVRVAHYGDSLIASDFLSGTARRLLQDRFGEGGHGFVAIANPWEWYFHNDVWHAASTGWRQSRVSGPLVKDGAYGPGGVVFRGSAGAAAYFGTAREGDYGRSVSQFQVLYAARPGGGQFELKTATTTTTVDTNAEREEERLATAAVPDAEGKLSVRVTRGEVKLYGVALERDEGLVYDAMGVLGARAKMWSHLADEHWKKAYALRPPTLVAVQYGTNEIESGGVDAAEYTETLTALVRKWRAAAPDASFVLVAPPDFAERLPKSAGFRSSRNLAKLVEMQRGVAQAEGVAFFDTIAAMGGDGAMPRWLLAHPPLCSTDLIHPTSAGGEALGKLFVHGLLGGYAAWRHEHPEAPRLAVQ